MKKIIAKIAKTVLIVLASIIALGVLIGILTNLIVVISVHDDVYSDDTEFIDSADYSEDKYDCIIVLGCSVYSDGTPSPFLEDRLKTAVSLYESGAASTILLSGDHSQSSSYNEVSTMFDYCVDAGVPVENIYLDHFGYSTYETMYRAANVFGIDNAIIVTQHYHVCRAVYDAQAFGIDAVGVSAVNSGYVVAPKNYIREFLARSKDFVFDIVKPDIEDHNEDVDIAGDGRQTQSDRYLEEHT